jgi:hypothetical protein
MDSHAPFEAGRMMALALCLPVMLACNPGSEVQSVVPHRTLVHTPERSLHSRRLKLYNLAGAKFTDSPVESLQ